MVERLGIPVFNNIRSALDCTAKVREEIFFNHFRAFNHINYIRYYENESLSKNWDSAMALIR